MASGRPEERIIKASACGRIASTTAGSSRNIAAIVPIVEPDRKRALRLLASIGPVEMPERR